MKNHLQNNLRFIPLFALMLCFTIPAMAQLVPSDLMDNCKQWKITYPDNIEDKTLCGEANNEYFHVSDDGDAIVFYTPLRSDNASTENSDYIRSELRERVVDGSVDIYWTTEGSHMLYVKQAITHLPTYKDHLVATQIHGNKDAGIDDAMVLRLENKHLFLSFNGAKLRSNVTIKTDYTLGTIHEVIFLVEDGKHYCYYSEDGGLLGLYNSGNADAYLVRDEANNTDYVMDRTYVDSYFKVGNYTQSNISKEEEYANDAGKTYDPSVVNYGEVYVYDFSVEHGKVNVTDVSLSPSTVDLSIGSTKQLSAIVMPTDASNIGVSYKSNNTWVATVNASGIVTAISVGDATITVTTNDGGFTDTSVITVVTPAIGDNLALNKPISGTGTPDGTNVAANLVDGLTSTRWAVSGFPQTAIIDLGALYLLGRTEMVCYSDRAYQFTVSISNTENGTYTQIVDRSTNTTPGTATNPIINTFAGINGRFVKITITGAASYTGSWMSLTEFRVFENLTLSLGDGISLKDEILIWPNPATNLININNSYDFNTLTVYDQIGKLILNQPIENTFVDISNLIPGLYIFRLSGNDKTINQRVIKR